MTPFYRPLLCVLLGLTLSGCNFGGLPAAESSRAQSQTPSSSGSASNARVPTSLSELSGVLPVANGGTGGSSLAELWNSMGLSDAAAMRTDNGPGSLVVLESDGSLPPLNAGQLTDVRAENLVGALPALDGRNLQNLSASNVTGVLQVSQGGTGAATAAEARTNLELGSAAQLDAGTSASNLVQLDNQGRLPAVDGSQLVNLPGSGNSRGFCCRLSVSASEAIPAGPVSGSRVYLFPYKGNSIRLWYLGKWRSFTVPEASGSTPVFIACRKPPPIPTTISLLMA